jgi:hypothetical protein
MPSSGLATITYLEGSAFIGNRRSYCCGVTTEGSAHSGYWPHTAYFCPVCGEIWARAVYTHEYDYRPLPSSPWAIETRRCVQHGDGQLLVGIPPGDCSDELVKREFAALMFNYQPEKE